jgi:arylformamidase
MRRYIDISVPTSSRTTVYPGDPTPKIEWPYWSHEKGDPASVGFYSGGLHHGTHVDVPWHFEPGGTRLGEIPLEHWLGPCWVADLTAEPECVHAAALQQAGIPQNTRRLLFKTRNSRREYWHEPWNEKFIYLHRSAAQWCVDQGVWTVGLDYLTVDPPTEPEFPAHHTCLANGVTIIENLNLRDVAPGPYELIAAPINMPEADGAWCRALLCVDA